MANWRLPIGVTTLYMGPDPHATWIHMARFFGDTSWLLRCLLNKCSTLWVNCQAAREIQERSRTQHQLSIPLVVPVAGSLPLHYPDYSLSLLMSEPLDQLCTPNLHGQVDGEHIYDHLMWNYLMLQD